VRVRQGRPRAPRGGAPAPRLARPPRQLRRRYDQALLRRADQEFGRARSRQGGVAPGPHVRQRRGDLLDRATTAAGHRLSARAPAPRRRRNGVVQRARLCLPPAAAAPRGAVRPEQGAAARVRLGPARAEPVALLAPQAPAHQGHQTRHDGLPRARRSHPVASRERRARQRRGRHHVRRARRLPHQVLGDARLGRPQPRQRLLVGPVAGQARREPRAAAPRDAGRRDRLRRGLLLAPPLARHAPLLLPPRLLPLDCPRPDLPHRLPALARRDARARLPQQRGARGHGPLGRVPPRRQAQRRRRRRHRRGVRRARDQVRARR